MSNLPVATLKLGNAGPTIGIDLKSYREVLGDAFWSFIEERLIRIAEKIAQLPDALTIWATLEPTGELIIYFAGTPEDTCRSAILENTADLGFEDADIANLEMDPSAEPLFATRNGKIVAFVDDIDPVLHEEGPKTIVFQEGEFLWAGYQLIGSPESIEYSLYRLVGTEDASYHVEEERKVTIHFYRYLIEE